MIARARADRRNPPSASFEQAEALDYLRRGPAFDCIVAIAVLHHLDLEPALALIKAALRPGGTLLLLDLVDRRGPRYVGIDALAVCLRFARAHVHAARRTPELRRAWREHGAGDRYLTPAQARALAHLHLPRARFRHHLLWRYSIRWTKP